MVARIVIGSWAIERDNRFDDVERTESVDLYPGKIHSVSLVESFLLFRLMNLDSGLFSGLSSAR